MIPEKPCGRGGRPRFLWSRARWRKVMNMLLASGSFSGHESFPFRYTWLTKGVRHCASDPTIFTKPEAMALLGVGKNMVRSIRHWCLACGVIEEDSTQPNNRGRWLRPTELGRSIFGDDDHSWDPYMEDVGTLWLLHWQLTTDLARATTWHFAFSHIHDLEFTRPGLELAVGEFARRIPNVRASKGTIKRDIEVFVRTYAPSRRQDDVAIEDSLDCPLAELGLILPMEDAGCYRFNRGSQKTLPDLVFAYAVGQYFRRWLSVKTISLEELAYASDSPGRVFKLDEYSLGERLERIHKVTDGAWHFSETAGLKQLVAARQPNEMDFLARHYGRSRTVKRGGAA